MRSRSTQSDPANGRPRFANEIASAIVAVKSASERGRAESIRDVVDAYRRLYGSVQRFVLMLCSDPLSFASVGTSGSPTLNQLLSILAERARAASFARLPDLKAAIEEARSADQLRDAIFSDAFSNDLAALRKVVAELERLDAAFIGLCVGHVLEKHTPVAVETPARPATRSAGRQSRNRGVAATAKALAQTVAAALSQTPTAQHAADAEATLVGSND